MYQYNVYTLRDMFDNKLFNDVAGIKNLKKFLGVKTKKEADEIVHDIIKRFFEEMLDHFCQGGKVTCGMGLNMMIHQERKLMAHIYKQDGIKIFVHQNKWLIKKSKRVYHFNLKNDYKKRTDALYDEILGIKWESGLRL